MPCSNRFRRSASGALAIRQCLTSRDVWLSTAKRSARSVHHRIVSAQNGTALQYELDVPAQQVLRRRCRAVRHSRSFRADYPFMVRSQDNYYPIYAAVFMSGTVNPSPYGDGEPSYNVNGEGDPDFVNLIADEQFLDHYVFFIDHTYANSTLTLVRRNDGQGFKDVTVDCLGTAGDWRPLGSDGTIEYTWLVLTKDGVGTKVGDNACKYGRHEASSDGPFELYVWEPTSSRATDIPPAPGAAR